jgi:hypothetical protein
MILEKTTKSLITIKLISYIIINIIKLRELYAKLKNNESSNKILNKFIFVKDITKFTLDILSFNLLSILGNSLSYYSKLKKVLSYITKPFR